MPKFKNLALIRWVQQSILVEVLASSRLARWLAGLSGAAGIVSFLWNAITGPLSPPSISQAFLRAPETVRKVIGFVPTWVWFFLLLATLVIAAIEYFGKVLIRNIHDQLRTINQRYEDELKPSARVASEMRKVLVSRQRLQAVERRLEAGGFELNGNVVLDDRMRRNSIDLGPNFHWLNEYADFNACRDRALRAANILPESARPEDIGQRHQIELIALRECLLEAKNKLGAASKIYDGK